MTNVIALTVTASKTSKTPQPRQSDNIVSFEDWRARPHPIRTASGVFFVSNMWGHSGDAA
ncbi:MAG: hypothetical protein AB3N15_03290 [Paracoccaceae bacterium]